MIIRIFFILILLIPYSNAHAQEGIGSLISPGKLTSPHADYEGLRNCTQCHALGGGIPDSKCLDCHDKLAARIVKKEGVHAKFSDPCIKCHTDHKGRGFKITELDEKEFDHDDSGYPLEDKHSVVDCNKCHKKSGIYTGLSQDCTSCHKDPHKNELGKDCIRCHNIKGWESIEKFNHDRDSKYTLTGKHVEVKCSECHVKNRYKIQKFEECLTCHKDPHKDKPKCKECHTTDSWKKVKIDHDKTKYPLTGKHTDVSCDKCHQKGQLKGIPYKTCNNSACHDDPHKKQFTDKTCEICHTTKEWKPSLFDHDSPKYPGYKLEGKHSKVACDKCHVKGRYKPLNTKSCNTSDCHNDIHKGQFKDQTCEKCHTVKGWSPSLFEHNAAEYKGYKLDGKHLRVDCAKCHISGKYKPVSSNCFDCHEKDDTHKKELGKNCEKCHNTSEWEKYTLDHNKQTKFPLIGKHKDTRCDKCHEKNRYKTKAEKCIDCHKDIHKGQFKEECSSCHTQTDWFPRKFDHKNKTGYELRGVHNDILCSSCHKTKDEYKGANRYCNQCHVDPHFNQFGAINCSQCHNERTWSPTQFDHSKTGYPLVGQHRRAECQDCHKNRTYRNTKSACIGCHLNKYNSAPNHVSGGYSQNCVKCHPSNTGSWAFAHKEKTGCSNCHLSSRPASHINDTQKYSTTCENCHKSTTAWTFSHGTVTTGCSSCHLNDRPASHTNDTLKYSMTCEDCHKTTSAWIPVSHPSVTTGCSSCHVNDKPASHVNNPQKYPNTCENCHKSTAIWTIDHSTISTGCSDCHLSDRPSSHTSDTTKYTTTCENCHKYPTWTFSHTTLISGCSNCHLSKYPTAHNTYSTRFSTTCENCHKYPSWSTATFSHTFTAFPTNHKGASKCSDCHSNQNYGNKGGCTSCHGDKHKKGYTNSQCLNCHPTGKE